MPNRPQGTPQDIPSKRTGSIKNVQENAAITVAETLSDPKAIEGITPTEQFLGEKYLTNIQGLEGEKREIYIASVTNKESFKPIIKDFLERIQLDEKVSVSRVIAYIQAHLS